MERFTVRSERHLERLMRKNARKMRRAKSEQEWWDAFLVSSQLIVGQAIADAMNDGVPHHEACRRVETTTNELMHEIVPEWVGWIPQFAITYEGDAVVAVRPYAEEREPSEQ